MPLWVTYVRIFKCAAETARACCRWSKGEVKCLTCNLGGEICQYNSAYFSKNARFYLMSCRGQFLSFYVQYVHDTLCDISSSCLLFIKGPGIPYSSLVDDKDGKGERCLHKEKTRQRFFCFPIIFHFFYYKSWSVWRITANSPKAFLTSKCPPRVEELSRLLDIVSSFSWLFFLHSFICIRRQFLLCTLCAWRHASK